MAIIKRYKIGNTRISVHDDYCVKTEEEKKQILRNMSDIIGRAIEQGMVFEDKPLEFDEPLIVCDENWQPITSN